MDIQLKKRPWYIRYRYYLLAGAAFAGFLAYVVNLSLSPDRLRIRADKVQIAEVKEGDFMEYVDVEGIIQPILTIKVNTREEGSVERIVAEEGSLLHRGDTILLLSNPDLLRSIEEQRDEWQKQAASFREKEIEMQQQSITLQQQSLQTDYDLKRLQKSYELDKEEFRMGIKSKAQLEVSEDEYRFKLQSARLQRESLRHDSAVSIIRREMLRDDLSRERKKFERARERVEHLVVKAPIDGQLSFVGVTPGQQVASNQAIAEIKVLDHYKVHTSLSEYYIDRITVGLPATIDYQGRKYPLKISKVVPEVKDRTFDVDLVFTADMPDNVRLGKSFRVQVELGQPEQALIIPRGNFYNATLGQWIYKVDAGRTKAVRVPLSIGRQNPRQYEVTAGLQPGDLVITTDYDTFGDAEELILDGMKE
ncbi:MAG: efflux RND transporter periplasmic adaptor subunit [Bacteroides sp.]|nr:efflux RND transporter periplasmic adaptor subunit [Bacteroides sp.]